MKANQKIYKKEYIYIYIFYNEKEFKFWTSLPKTHEVSVELQRNETQTSTTWSFGNFRARGQASKHYKNTDLPNWNNPFLLYLKMSIS